MTKEQRDAIGLLFDMPHDPEFINQYLESHADMLKGVRAMVEQMTSPVMPFEALQAIAGIGEVALKAIEDVRALCIEMAASIPPPAIAGRAFMGLDTKEREEEPCQIQQLDTIA